MIAVNYVRLDGSDKIVAAGMLPDRQTYDRFIEENPMPGFELIETEENLTSFILHTYNRDTGETTPPEPPPVVTPFTSSSGQAITMESLITALDEKDHGDPSKWQDLLAQTKSNTSSGQPS